MPATTIPTLDIVRRIVGRRHRITRAEMADILRALQNDGLDLRNEYVRGTLDLTQKLNAEVGGYPPSPDAVQAWVDACRDITVISVDARGLRDGCVRYDQPGSMHPQQHAELMFVAEKLGHYEYDQVGQMRRRADRVLVVQETTI